jgi:hypothetical protein
VSLASVAPSVWHSQSHRAGPRPRGADGAVLTELELARAAQKAVALAQQEKSAWTRLLRIEAITRRGLLVRRALDADPGTGQRRWTDRHFVFNKYKMPNWDMRSPITRPRAAP